VVIDLLGSSMLDPIIPIIALELYNGTPLQVGMCFASYQAHFSYNIFPVFYD
jgi:hypothetical protein